MIASFFILSPIISVLITNKFIYKEYFINYGLNFKNLNLKGLFIVPLVFITSNLFLIIMIYLFGNVLHVESFGSLDMSVAGFIERTDLIASTGKTTLELPSIVPYLVLFFSIFLLPLISWIPNIPFTLGEEHGWRGFLVKEMGDKLSVVKLNILIGIIWGLWHSPLVLMGLNFPSHPVAGVFVMTFSCICLSFPHYYVVKKANSIYAAAILHGMINSIAAVYPLLMKNSSELFSSMIRVFGGIGFLLSYFIFNKVLPAK